MISCYGAFFINKCRTSGIDIIQLTSTDDLKGRVKGDSAIAPCTKALYDKVKNEGKICDISTKNGIVCLKSET